jgi:hypothetical protein
MPNLTQEQRLVRRLSEPAFDPGHYLVVLVRQGTDWQLHSCLEPGKSFDFLYPPVQYQFYFVPATEPLSYRFRTDLLSVTIQYRISNFSTLVQMVESDPLKLVAQEVEKLLRSLRGSLVAESYREQGIYRTRLYFFEKRSLPISTQLQDSANQLGIFIERIVVFDDHLPFSFRAARGEKIVGHDGRTTYIKDLSIGDNFAYEAPPQASAPSQSRSTPGVLVSHLSPTSVRPGASFPLDIILHLSSIEPLAPKGHKVEEAVAIHIPSGTELLISLVPPEGFEIEDSKGLIAWKPPRARLQFLLTAPALVKDGYYWAKVKIQPLGASGIELCRFYIQIRVSHRRNRTPLHTRIQTVKRLPRSAFASYSRKDTVTVLQRVAALSSIGVDVFVDCLDIKEGSDWEDALNSNTISKDTFLLFWSRNASASTWVDREWRHALRARGLSYITPNALEPPDVCPPPTELASLQFGSAPLLIAHSAAKKSSLEAPPSLGEAVPPEPEAGH